MRLSRAARPSSGERVGWLVLAVERGLEVVVTMGHPESPTPLLIRARDEGEAVAMSMLHRNGYVRKLRAGPKWAVDALPPSLRPGAPGSREPAGVFPRLGGYVLRG